MRDVFFMFFRGGGLKHVLQPFVLFICIYFEANVWCERIHIHRFIFFNAYVVSVFEVVFFFFPFLFLYVRVLGAHLLETDLQGRGGSDGQSPWVSLAVADYQ